MFITPSLKKSLIVEQFQGNYLKDWNALDSDLKNSDTIYQFRGDFLYLFTSNLEFTIVYFCIF